MHVKSWLLLLGAGLGLAIAYGLTQGAVHIPLEEFLRSQNRTIVLMRALRIITAVLAGSGLAVCGIVLQAILRNSLAEPYVLGTSSGAGLAAVGALILGVSRLYVPIAAFVGALVSIVLVYYLAKERSRVADTSLILAGVIVSIAFSSLIVFLVTLFGSQAMHEMAWWLWGSLQVYDPRLIGWVAGVVVPGVAVVYMFSQDLNAISMGEEEAMHLGVDTQKVKMLLIILTTLITASLICVCGIIGFVGLIVPHGMRYLVGPNHKVLIPVSCLAASVFMVACDAVARTCFAPVEIPIGVITAIIGAPVFILLLKRSRR